MAGRSDRRDSMEFYKGNKYFAIGMLTTVIGVHAVLFLAFIVMIVMWSGGF